MFAAVEQDDGQPVAEFRSELRVACLGFGVDVGDLDVEVEFLRELGQLRVDAVADRAAGAREESDVAAGHGFQCGSWVHSQRWKPRVGIAMVNTWFGDRRYRWQMSEQTPGGPSFGQGTSRIPAASPTPGPYFPPQWLTPTSQALRWPTFAALAIALLATALAIVGWFRPMPRPVSAQASGPAYTDQQIADAKTRACQAFELVRKGVALQTNPPPNDDPGTANAQAAHAQLSLVAGADYLRDRLDPATPAPLAKDIRQLAALILDIGVNALAGAKNADPSQSALIKAGNDAVDRAAGECK